MYTSINIHLNCPPVKLQMEVIKLISSSNNAGQKAVSNTQDVKYFFQTQATVCM